MIIDIPVAKLFKMKAERVLTKRHEFSLVLDRGGSKAGRLVVVKALASGMDVARYGLVASKKVGGAVVRNRARRRLREVIRGLKLKPGWDIVFIIRWAITTAEYSAIDREVRTLLAAGRLLLESNEESRSGTN